MGFELINKSNTNKVFHTCNINRAEFFCDVCNSVNSITVDNDNNEIELTNITNEAAGITGTSTALTTGKAVHEYVTANDANTTYTAGSHITIDTANGNAIAVNDITSAGADIGTGDTGLTTGNAVYEYVTNAVDGIGYSGDTYITVDNGTNEIGLTNITSAASGIDTNDNGLTTGKAVYDFVTANDDNTTYTGSGYVSIDGNNNITVTNVTNEADGIIAGNTELTTANAVFEYVDELTGAVLPQGCENGNCALVKLNGQLQWVDLTTPLQ